MNSLNVGGLTRGLSPLPPAALPPLLLPPLVGVTDLLMGVVGFSSSFLVEGVLALEEVPLRGLFMTERMLLLGYMTTITRVIHRVKG